MWTFENVNIWMFTMWIDVMLHNVTYSLGKVQLEALRLGNVSIMGWKNFIKLKYKHLWLYFTYEIKTIILILFILIPVCNCDITYKQAILKQTTLFFTFFTGNWIMNLFTPAVQGRAGCKWHQLQMYRSKWAWLLGTDYFGYRRWLVLTQG